VRDNLLKGLTLKKFGSLSIRRNEIIADLFCRPHKVERPGSGIRKMRNGMDPAGLAEPEFYPEGFFTAIFRRSSEYAMKE
jgi:predicted HTH transcriptional regulator